MDKRALILLGGTWHDFEGFLAHHRPLLEAGGWRVEATYDLERLTRLAEDGIGLVVSYTCFTAPREGEKGSGPEGMSAAQLSGLAAWVREGGALLGAHAATVLGSSGAELGKLLGGEFLSHPPQFAFPVYPVSGDHPIVSGIEAFCVFDEFYIQRQTAPVDIHMVAIDRGVAYPMVWSKSEGGGRVAYLAMGHSESIWSQPTYRKLFAQAVAWLRHGAAAGSAPVP
jgi:type 1 glutamine amidotransferase